MWNLGDDAVEKLKELPETGMGFQIVEASLMGCAAPLLVLNAHRAIDISSIGLEPGDDPGTVLRNGLKVVDLLKSEIAQTLFAAPAPRILRLLGTRVGGSPSLAGGQSATSVVTALPSSLVKHVKLAANRVFYRYSAFNPDRRVDPKTGNFLAGTYATPESEAPLVPTGFVAVGRFALPVNLPASHRYEIEAPIGTGADFGTVAPAYGQAGGGVEAFFAKAVVNAQSIPKYQHIPDE